MAEQKKLYDTATIEMIGRNSPTFLNEMIVMFVTLVSKDLEALKQAAANSSWVEVGQLAHKIKSATGNMAVTSVVPYINALEYGTGDKIENFINLEKTLNEVLAQIRADYPQLF